MIILNPRFWASATLVGLALAAMGVGLARALLPAPLAYYHTPYMSLVIPKGWLCGLDGTEFVCQAEIPTEEGPERDLARSAIIVLAAKETGPMDSLAQYRAHLRTPREYNDRDSSEALSVVEGVSDREIGGRLWVIGSQFASEIPNFRTHYYATVADEIAVLVTFSVHEDYVAAFLDDVEDIVENLSLHKPAGGSFGARR